MLTRKQKQMLRSAAEAGGYELRTRTAGPDCVVVLISNSGLPRPDGLPHFEVVGKCGRADFPVLCRAIQDEWDRITAGAEYAA